MARPGRRLRAAALVAALPLLAACAETGDFGRPKPTFWSQTAEPFLGAQSARARGEAVGSTLLTDDEQELRSRAWRFLMPARERNWFEGQVAALAVSRVVPGEPADPSRYYQAISAMPDLSPRARYQRLREDVEVDRQLMGPFAAVACRVIEMDRVRLRALERVTAPSPELRASAEARVGENDFIIRWVREAWNERVAAYRYALERLVVDSPDRDAIRSERQLTALDLDRGGLDRYALDRCGAPARGTVTVSPAGPRYTPRADKPELPPK